MAERPNLLVLVTDQQRFDTLPCYGNRMMKTPNIDTLARESLVIERAYTAQPVCTPARSTIWTGLYPHATGCVANDIPLRPETRTVAEMVCQEYVCGYFGKWHLGDEFHAQHGFETWVSIDDIPAYYPEENPPDRSSDYHRFLVEQGFSPDVEVPGTRIFGRNLAAGLPEHLTKAAFLGRKVAEFIRNNRDRPFVACANFHEPHSPFTGPFDDLYDADEIPVGPAFMKVPNEKASLLHQRLGRWYSRAQFKGFDLTEAPGWQRLRTQYLGLVTLVDRAVGDILRALEESGQWEETMVVFTSDHGEMAGDHSLVTKGVMYEEAVRVPLLIRAPGYAPRNVPGCMSLADLTPTLLEMMGEQVPEGLHGQSCAGLFEHEDDLSANDTFIEWNGEDGRDRPGPHPVVENEEEARILKQPWRTVVSHEGWKLNLSAADQCELYDLSADPHELTNLFEVPGQRSRVRELTDRVRAWQEQTGDESPLPAV